jgi:predicted nucleotidyltransferase
MNRATETQIHDPVLGEIVRRLVDDCQPERIDLFGSRARGNAGADSNYDIMVVVAKSEAFDSRIHLRASLPATNAREGQLLYAA